ncbi:MAG: methylenetetrahydrofolate reductase [Planktomarina sp.]
MALFNFGSKEEAPVEVNPQVEAFLKDYSIEVMPRTAAKVENFRELLPAGTRVYIAHIEGTPIAEMVDTAKRIAAEGFPVMPHFPARIIKDEATLREWIKMYQGEAGVDQALLLAGGVTNPHGDYQDSMQLLQTDAFGDAGFKRLHVAGHPEGNKDIDADGSMTNVTNALRWKQTFSESSDADMALATQFCFEAGPVIEWADSLKEMDIDIPIHIGVAGPAKLQTLIKFSIACGVGASLKVLQKRAKDLPKLLLPFEPDEFLTELAAHKAANPDFNITHVHFFPLGGIKTNAKWNIANGGTSTAPVSQA